MLASRVCLARRKSIRSPDTILCTERTKICSLHTTPLFFSSFHHCSCVKSALGARGHIRTHCGATNTVLKMHLRLAVPTTAQSATATMTVAAAAAAAGKRQGLCASMRVGRKSRNWKDGKVLFFDDSFEHEVHNDCEEERVIFQVVLKHPLLY